MPTLLQFIANVRGSVRDPLRGASRYGDLVLAGMLVVVVALFVLPLPTVLLDFLIALNLAISLLLLIVAMYVPSALALSSFPSLLLFTTLFRLALNIASAKLILLQAHAGQIIETFGRLIVGNNVVVGGVVFLIIAIVQFIVVAKGSERVAEVSARFALDAMPGKQMSIDADVRAGSLSPAQAQRKRHAIEQESQLHGAMDGAMKFVKGDAIASIVIALVNILGGLAIGTLMLDMGIGSALQRYAILTVGDGMVSQIPSLLISIAAGMVITRVSNANAQGPSQLSTQIGQQLFAHPRALMIAGAAVAAFLVVPGFPKAIFLLLAALLVGLGLMLRTRSRTHRVSEWIAHDEAADSLDQEGDHAVAFPLAVELSTSLREAVPRHALDRSLASVKSAIEGDLGPVFPRMQLSYRDTLDIDGYRILVNDVAVGAGSVRHGLVLVDLAGESPQGSQPGDEPVVPFGPFAQPVWSVPDARRSHAPGEVIAMHLGEAVRRNVRDLIGIQDVHRLAHSVQREAPELAAEALRSAPAQKIADVLRRLLQEGIPIRNLHAIFEAIAQWASSEEDPIALAEHVRVRLGRSTTARYVGADRKLDAIVFETALVERVLAAIQRTPRGSFLVLSPAESQDIREQVRRIVAGAPPNAVGITSIETRRYVKQLIEPMVPKLPVLSYNEIDEDVSLQPVGWVTAPQPQ